MWDKLLSILGGNLFTGVDQIIRDFKLPPEQLAAYEAAKQQAELQAKTALEKIDAEDRASARQREIAVRDKTPMLLALGITLGFFGILSWMLVHGVGAGNEPLYIMLGSLGTGFTMVLAYYFGSSSGSDQKNAMLSMFIQKGTGK